jgi:hypothetical protein
MRRDARSLDIEIIHAREVDVARADGRKRAGNLTWRGCRRIVNLE